MLRQARLEPKRQILWLAQPPPTGSAQLLELVLEQNPFQRARLEQLGLGRAPPSRGPAAAREARAGRGPGAPPAVRHQPHLPARALHAAAPDQRHHRPAAARARHAPRTGRGGASCFAHTLTRRGRRRRATAWRSPSRSARTSSSGPRTRGSQEVGAMAIALGGMTSVAAPPDDRRGRGDRALVHADLRAAARSRWRWSSGLEDALDSVEQRDLHRRAGRVAARRCARGSRTGFGARCVDHAGLTEAGPVRLPVRRRPRPARATRTSSSARSSTPSLRAGRGRRARRARRSRRCGRTGFPVLRYRTGDVVVNTERALPRRPRGPLAAAAASSGAPTTWS